MDANLILEKSNIISPKIFNFCRDARDTVFTKEIDIKIWSKCEYVNSSCVNSLLLYRSIL